MTSEDLKTYIIKRQKRQAELILKSQIQIAKSILKGHEPLNTYNFQKAIEGIKQFRNLSRRAKQTFKDLDLLVSTTHLDSQVVQEITSQFKFKVEHAKAFIESKFTVKNFKDMNLEEMASLMYPIHTRWFMRILPPITIEDVKRGLSYLRERNAQSESMEGQEMELQKVEDVELTDSNLFSDYILELYDEVKRKAGGKTLIKWDAIVPQTLNLGERSRIAQGLSHLSFQDKVWLLIEENDTFFQLNEQDEK
ncbi:MAG: hypothetical protein ACTSRC_19265 [Candidatus Helarchaeota archaeon]